MTFSTKIVFFLWKKDILTENLNNSYNWILYYIIKNRLRKFENDFLQTVGGDKFLMKSSIKYFIWNNKFYLVKLNS